MATDDPIDDGTFQAAADTVQALVQAGQLTDQATQLQLYGLYKQATSHWHALRGVDAPEARRRYVDVLRAAMPDWQPPSQPSTHRLGGPVLSSLAGCGTTDAPDDALPPLLAAARAGDVASVEQLLRQGAAVDARDEEGCTALHWAADGNHVAVMQVLLRHGANRTLCDSHGDTPLAMAQTCNHADAIAVLQQGEH